jgi:hypothetical protein
MSAEEYSMDSEITSELAGALQNVLWQTYQMQGMFSDDDHTIANAIADAEDVLKRYQKIKSSI